MEKIEVLQKEEDLSKLQKEEFNLETFYEQLKAAKKMGPLGDILGMLGMSDLPKDKVHESEGKLKSYECMINSMTKAEKKDPSLIKKSMPRMERIAKGSGRSVQELREFLSQFEKMEKMVNKFQKDRGFKKKLEQMMKSGKLNLPPGMNPGM